MPSRQLTGHIKSRVGATRTASRVRATSRADGDRNAGGGAAGSSLIEAVGELNEDWVPTLRIQRVLDAGKRCYSRSRLVMSIEAVEDAVDTSTSSTSTS